MPTADKTKLQKQTVTCLKFDQNLRRIASVLQLMRQRDIGETDKMQASGIMFYRLPSSSTETL